MPIFISLPSACGHYVGDISGVPKSGHTKNAKLVKPPRGHAEGQISN
ncbi:hypothetical protein RLEG12_11040 (plasmid) [Rhizobium leguminosarum bv. trifolii CB782]|nr:hypothetical protein RLEG12_11040 [Rhizobium leguminosarum bv. trifolii CB782]